MRFLAGCMILGLVVAGCRQTPPAGAPVVALPDGRPGIGFDDLQLSKTYGVLAPGGRSGYLDLVDPVTRTVTAIGGFSMEPLHFAGHDQGATAVAEGGGFLFVTDRTTQKLYVVDCTANPVEQGIVAGLVLDAVLQAAGASLLVLGMVRRKPTRLSVAPTPWGIVVGGRF
ncbi:MAG: hypothetical protein JWM53_6646 [bacterium]|nr:hypothetical protein [bacterium]